MGLTTRLIRDEMSECNVKSTNDWALEEIRTVTATRIKKAGLMGVDFCTNWCNLHINVSELVMRSTINLDDSLMERAKSLTGTKETAALVRQALETLVRVESGKRLIALGGTMPEAEAAPRRRSEVGK